MAERTNEELLDLFADLLEPCADILIDAKFQEQMQKTNKLPAIKTAIKNHKQSVIQILALIDDVPIEEYHVNLLTLPIRLLDLVNKPEVQNLFSSQRQKIDGAVSGSAMENITDGAN